MDFVASSNRTSVILQLKDLFEMLHYSSQRDYCLLFLLFFGRVSNFKQPEFSYKYDKAKLDNKCLLVKPRHFGSLMHASKK